MGGPLQSVICVYTNLQADTVNSFFKFNEISTCPVAAVGCVRDVNCAPMGDTLGVWSAPAEATLNCCRGVLDVPGVFDVWMCRAELSVQALAQSAVQLIKARYNSQLVGVRRGG